MTTTDPRDEWPEGEPGVMVGKCSYCGADPMQVKETHADKPDDRLWYGRKLCRPCLEERWPWSDPKTFEGECTCCGISQPVQMSVDPWFGEGIIDDPSEEPWCQRCIDQRCDDV